MIITMGAMGMVEVPINQVVHVITVGYRFMPTGRSMNMSAIVRRTGMIGRTFSRIRGSYGNHMFIDMLAVREM